MTTLTSELLTLPAALLGEDNPLPFFRESPNPSVPMRESLPSHKRDLMGWETGFRVLPYRMQDHYTRQRTPTPLPAIGLENEVLKATFLPGHGGRLLSLWHKPTSRELLCRNPVLQPANLAIRNAWFSGGIEWNIGQFGHTFSTCSPVFAAEIRGAQGEPGLRLYEFERCKRLFWQIDFYLPPGSPWLMAFTRIANPNPDDTSTYWWTNVAVPETQDTRVLAPARQAIYIDFDLGGHGFGCGDLPNLPSLNGADATYSLNSTFANEFFFQCDETDLPWEAALDRTGSGFIEASTPRLRYRKMFCWGNHQGGQHWQEFLSPGGQPYLEIQAGLAPTQLHGLSMPSGADWTWLQAFGCIQADPSQAHSPDWEVAWRTVDAALRDAMPMGRLRDLETNYRLHADEPPVEILSAGSGWGALESARRARDSNALPIPPSFAFPVTTLGHEQRKWLDLLNGGVLPEQRPEELPGEWMTQDEWFELLTRSLEHEAGRNWYALLHAGVMRMERFDEAGAESAWNASLQAMPSAWAHRNLAVLAHRRNRQADALAHYRQAWSLVSASLPHPALAAEYLQVLCAAGQFDRAREVYDSLPEALRQADRIQIWRGRIALELGDLEMVEQVLGREYAVVREGETELSDLWYEMWARRVAARDGVPLDDALRQRGKRDYPPHSHIDFRLTNSVS